MNQYYLLVSVCHSSNESVLSIRVCLSVTYPMNQYYLSVSVCLSLIKCISSIYQCLSVTHPLHQYYLSVSVCHSSNASILSVGKCLSVCQSSKLSILSIIVCHTSNASVLSIGKRPSCSIHYSCGSVVCLYSGQTNPYLRCLRSYRQFFFRDFNKNIEKCGSRLEIFLKNEKKIFFAFPRHFHLI